MNYEGMCEVKLYFRRFPYQKEWRLFLSTDILMAFLGMIGIYCARWTIEVFFKEVKQHLKPGTCQSRDFDAQLTPVRHATFCISSLRIFEG